MKDISSFKHIWLSTRHVDFRKQIQSLATLVQLELELDPFQPELFVFVGKKKDRIRLLYWDGTGFAMWAKQLEKGKYAWPKSFQACVYSMSYRDLQMLLDGYDIWRMKPHQQLQFSQVV